MAIFLKLGGVTPPPGLTRAKGFEEWVELLAFGWSASSRQVGAQAQRAARAPEFGAVTLRRTVDVFSRDIIEHAVTGRIVTVEVHITRTEDRTGGHLAFSNWRFERAFVADYTLGAAPPELGTETFSLHFTKLRYEHFHADNTGRVRRSGGSDCDLAGKG